MERSLPAPQVRLIFAGPVWKDAGQAKGRPRGRPWVAHQQLCSAVVIIVDFVVVIVMRHVTRKSPVVTMRRT
jgi:hypothetical protein